LTAPGARRSARGTRVVLIGQDLDGALLQAALEQALRR
jgi:hypothetical protein